MTMNGAWAIRYLHQQAEGCWWWKQIAGNELAVSSNAGEGVVNRSQSWVIPQHRHWGTAGAPRAGTPCLGMAPRAASCAGKTHSEQPSIPSRTFWCFLVCPLLAFWFLVLFNSGSCGWNVLLYFVCGVCWYCHNRPNYMAETTRLLFS